MFTHKIISKEFENGVLVLGVEFTDGTKTFTEAIKPQDEVGLKYWLKQRLASLDGLDSLENITVGEAVDLTEPEQILTPTEIKKREIQLAKSELFILKQEVDLGLVSQSEFDIEKEKVIALAAESVITSIKQ